MIDLSLRRHRSSRRPCRSAAPWIARVEALEPRLTLSTSLVSVGPVTSPRNQPVSTVPVAFSGAIDPKTFTITNVGLTFNGQPVNPGTGVTITPTDNTNTTFTIGGLQSLTTAAGTYVLTVNTTGIKDAGGSPVDTGSQSVTFQVVTAGPTITAISPITSPRTTPVSTVDVTFSEPIKPETFTTAALSLSRDFNTVALGTGVTITPTDTTNTTFRIAGLQDETTTPGLYVLGVDASGVQDLAGNAGTGSQTEQFIVEEAAPTITAIAPIASPRTTPVSTVDVTFSEPIDPTTFTTSALTLTLGGQPVPLGSGVTIAPTDTNNTTFRISGLEAATTAPGAYVMTVDASNVATPNGTGGSGSQMVGFVVQALVPVTDGPRVTQVQRFGFHAQPTLLVLTFDRDLDPTRAQNPSNYEVLNPGRDNRLGTADDVMVPIASVTYNPANRTVTLVMAQGLSVFTKHRVIARGTGAAPITDLNGNALDGDGNGVAGGDFVADFGREILAGPAPKGNTAQRVGITPKLSTAVPHPFARKIGLTRSVTSQVANPTPITTGSVSPQNVTLPTNWVSQGRGRFKHFELKLPTGGSTSN